MRKIRVGIRNIALIDDECFDALSGIKWVAKNGGGGRIYAWDASSLMGMHRVVVGASIGELVDHIDGNTLNNQRENLRVCTHAENMRNRKMRKDSSNSYKGVERFRGKYRARIKVDGVRGNIGVYETEIEAAMAYDKAALRLHGDFAATNRKLGLI